MNGWLEYIAASTGIYALVTLLDRYIMGRQVMTPINYLLIGNVVGMMVGTGVWFAFPELSELNFSAILLGFLVGIFFGVFNYLYFDTLRMASPVSTVAYMQIVPVIATTGGIFVLGEHLTETGLVAVLLLSVGLTFVSLLDRQNATLAAIKMIPATVLLAIGYIIQKVLLNKYQVSTLLALNRAGALFVALVLFLYWAVYTYKTNPSSRSWRSYSRLGLGAAIIGELASILALYWALVAYEKGPVAEVSAIASLLPVVVLLGAGIIRIATKVPFWEIPESRTGTRVLLSLVASALIATSVYLISARGITSGSG